MFQYERTRIVRLAGQRFLSGRFFWGGGYDVMAWMGFWGHLALALGIWDPIPSLDLILWLSACRC